MTSRLAKRLLGAAAAAVVLGAGILTWKLWKLDGQAPSWWRLVRTETGGQPHYEPIQYRAKDSRPAITNPVFRASSDIKMSGGTMGIGVAVAGEAKFYPLHVLAFHQVVNDTCGDKKIACTY
jgi:hypothetical protein